MVRRFYLHLDLHVGEEQEMGSLKLASVLYPYPLQRVSSALPALVASEVMTQNLTASIFILDLHVTGDIRSLTV